MDSSKCLTITQDQTDVNVAMALLPDAITEITVFGGEGVDQTAKTAAVKSYPEAIKFLRSWGCFLSEYLTKQCH